MNYKLFSVESNLILCYYSRPIEGVNSNLRSPMLNSLREWGERRSTRVFALKIAQKRLEFEGVCTVTNYQLRKIGTSLFYCTFGFKIVS